VAEVPSSSSAAGRSESAGIASSSTTASSPTSTDADLERYNEVGLTMPLLSPPFQDVPVAKTFDDLKRLREAIMAQVDAV
jgi:hypothetical protein